jgi:hypothetical protein
MRKTAESRLKRTLTLFVLASGPMLALGSCAYGELKQVLRAQVASEINCGDVTIESSSQYAPGYKPGQYRVKGCGVDRTYECPKETGLVSYNAKICTYVDPKSIKPAGPTPSAAGEEDPALAAPMDAPPPEPAPDGDIGATP